MPKYRFHAHARSAHTQLQRADGTVKGTAPFRAAAHCEPFRVASALGWLVFPPCDFALRWTGSGFQWAHAGVSDWLPAGKVTLGRLAETAGDFECLTADASRLPAIVALPEPGYLQLWTGLTCSSDAGWCTAIRAVPNFAAPMTYEALEGVVETDWWHGPLLMNLRFRRTDEPVSFRRTHPMMALQPFPRRLLTGSDFVHSLAAAEEGNQLAEAMTAHEPGRPGAYARIARQRRREAMPGATM